MKQFLIAGRLDGHPEALAKLQALVQDRQPDGVLFAGGILGNDPASLAEKRARWEEFFDGLGRPGVFTAVVPGSAEAPLREFLRLAKDAELEHPNIHVAHATLFERGNVAVCGLGGELTEAEDRTEDRLSYSRVTAEYFLRALWRSEQPHKILLLNAAPPGQLGGEAGNPICGDLIDSYHPSLCVVAGTTERRGFQRIAHTLVVNPGRLADGSVAWLDWNRDKGEQVEFLTR
jgi:Icc-related predicted phosphoesterase